MEDNHNMELEFPESDKYSWSVVLTLAHDESAYRVTIHDKENGDIIDYVFINAPYDILTDSISGTKLMEVKKDIETAATNLLYNQDKTLFNPPFVGTYNDS